MESDKGWENKVEPTKCDKCGKSMVDENGVSCIGIQIVVTDTDKAANVDFYKKQLGKYEINREYGFCCECWLDSLMGK